MGLFDEALESVGRGTVEAKWDQAENGCGTGVCATVVTRWMKYKMAGNPNFWAMMKSKDETANPQMISNRQAILKKWDRIKSKQESFSAVTKKTKSDGSHFQGKYAINRMAGLQASRGVKSPKVSKKLKEKFSHLGYESTDPTPVRQVDDVISEVASHPGRASYMSLTQQSLAHSAGHAVGFYCDENRKIYFFDPNMGEVSFVDVPEFKSWFRDHYQSKWHQGEKGVSNYAFFDTVRATSIQGLVGLEAARKTAKWIKELVELVDIEDPFEDDFWKDDSDPFETSPAARSSGLSFDDFNDLLRSSDSLSASAEFDDFIIPEFD
jgi:Yersinia/Haemophilus virulence surface antigen